MYKIAVLGATGNVGRQILAELAATHFPYKEIYALASRKSLRTEVSFGQKTLQAKAADLFDFSKVDLVLSSVGSAVIQTFSQKIQRAGAILIDNSSAFRMQKTTPLIVPEINSHCLSQVRPKSGQRIANPNCVAIPLSMTLKALSHVAPLSKVVVSTYQSVSGAGRQAMNTLYNQVHQSLMGKEAPHAPFDRQIAFNVIPAIDIFSTQGATEEEQKIIQEINKILEKEVKIAITCVRVPVFVGHSMSVNVQFKHNILLSNCQKALRSFPGIILYQKNTSVSPLEIAGTDMVHVCRLRNDQTKTHSVTYWAASDNLRKGAAQNAVQIALALHHAWQAQHTSQY